MEHTLTSHPGPLGTLLASSGLRLSAAGPDEIKMSLNLTVASGSATWKVIRLSGRELELKLVGSSGVPRSALRSERDIRIHPRLPPGVQISSVRVTPNGVVFVLSR